MDKGIVVGSDRETVAEVRMMINDILSANCDQCTKMTALDAATKMCSISNTTISECIIGDQLLPATPSEKSESEKSE
jgi:hypothetical protein